MIRFIWDGLKAAANRAKHGMSFEEAATAFGDPLSLTISDDSHAVDEDRMITVGRTSADRLVVVVHCDVDEDTICLISARRATPREKKDYEQKGNHL